MACCFDYILHSLDIKMVSLDKAVIARLKTHGENFEIFVDPDLALDYKEGKKVDINELLAAREVFKDAKAGKRASEEVMNKILGTIQLNEVVDRIIKKGELHFTLEQRKRMIEEKRKKIVSIIARNAINPQTKTPHPPSRIEKAIEEAKISIDPFRSTKEQVDSVVKEIRPILPIKFETLELAVKIPANYAGNSYRILREFGEVKKEEWDKGDLLCLLEIPAGIQDEFYSRLNSLTHGDVKIKVLR